MRKVGKSILIIPQGWTEYNYASELKRNLCKDTQRGISIKMPKASKNSAMQLLALAKEELKNGKKRSPLDLIWIILDNDNQPDIQRFFLEIDRNNYIKIAYSCICIEHWFIIHLQDIRQSFNRASDAENTLNNLWKRTFMQEYHKTNINHFSLLHEFLDTAISRARMIEQSVERDKINKHEANPFFTMHHFIEFFRNL